MHSAATLWTAEKQTKLLAAMRKTGTLQSACRVAKVDRGTVYNHRTEGKPCYDAEFAKLYDEAAAEGHAAMLERYEKEADRRAMTGLVRKKFHNGTPITDPKTGEQYEEREYSDTLLMFRMKRLDPSYKDRMDITSGGDKLAAPVTILEVILPPEDAPQCATSPSESETSSP